MNSSTEPIFDLGTGVYTIPDVAAILNLPSDKVRRWLREYWNAQFGQSGQYAFSVGKGRDLTVNFLTLIEFYTFFLLREEGASVRTIVNAHKTLEKYYQTRYPFATSTILTDGRKIFFSSEMGEIVHADASFQVTIAETLNPFCKKIEFDDNGLAERFFPLGREHDVVIDPERQFGQPVVGQTNILTETVFNLHRGGESVEFIARIYDLNINQVQDAINFYHRNAA